MALVPHRFLVRLLYTCPYVKAMPRDDEDGLLVLPESARLDSFAELDDAPNFADVRLGWNETGLGLTVDVRGTEHFARGEVSHPRSAEGVTLLLDMRGDRTGHRATRTCQQFHFLPSVGVGHDQPAVIPEKINRALVDAPLPAAEDVPFRFVRLKGGYRLEAFLSANVLSGFDPEQYPRLGVFYSVRNTELGEQTPGVDRDFPFWEDPSLWASLELTKE